MLITRAKMLEKLVKIGHARVVGRTSYRTASVKDIVLTCSREEISFLEDMLTDKDNHVVIIFQILHRLVGWERGTYYAFVFDSNCNIGKEIVYEEF